MCYLLRIQQYPVNTNQLITYYIQVRYLLRIQQYTVNTTYNIALLVKIIKKKHFFNNLKIIFFLTDKLKVKITLPCGVVDCFTLVTFIVSSLSNPIVVLDKGLK